jgi:hypothetical protein
MTPPPVIAADESSFPREPNGPGHIVGPGVPPSVPEMMPPVGEEKRLREDAARLAQVGLGLAAAGFAIAVLAQPQLSLSGLLILLGEAVGILSLQTILAGGRLLNAERTALGLPTAWWRRLRSLGLVAIGIVALSLTAFAVLDPSLAETAAVLVLAVVMVSQGFGRVLQGTGMTMPGWLRNSSTATGVFIVALVVLTLLFNGLVLVTFAILVGVIVLVSGIEGVVAGLHPTDPRQFVILKLVLFSSFYGLILINWIDLFGKTVPAYGIWLLLTYMAPFGVLIVFQGLEAWPLAISLGLLVSLNNDVGYFFVGNLLFGFHEQLGPWIAGQLGLHGDQIVTVFYGGRFTIDVTSWMMGLSIYLRAAVVGAILYYWWQRPGEIVAKSALPGSVAPS